MILKRVHWNAIYLVQPKFRVRNFRSSWKKKTRSSPETTSAIMKQGIIFILTSQRAILKLKRWLKHWETMGFIQCSENHSINLKQSFLHSNRCRVPLIRGHQHVPRGKEPNHQMVFLSSFFKEKSIQSQQTHLKLKKFKYFMPLKQSISCE